MKPFLKWAGNKFQIVKQIRKILPMGKRLIEPFVGSGVGAGAEIAGLQVQRYISQDGNHRNKAGEVLALFR